MRTKLIVSAAAIALVAGLGAAHAEDPITTRFETMKHMYPAVLTDRQMKATRGAGQALADIVGANWSNAITNSDGKVLNGIVTVLSIPPTSVDAIHLQNPATPPPGS